LGWAFVRTNADMQFVDRGLMELGGHLDSEYFCEVHLHLSFFDEFAAIGLGQAPLHGSTDLVVGVSQAEES